MNWQVYPQNIQKIMKENNIPESFENAMNDLVVGRVVPLNTALNEPYEEKSESLVKENERLIEDLKLYKKVNIDLRKEIRMLEKLIELNMKDLWDIADQRDWYYEEYQKLKRKEELKQAAWRRK